MKFRMESSQIACLPYDIGNFTALFAAAVILEIMQLLVYNQHMKLFTKSKAYCDKFYGFHRKDKL